VRPRVSEPESKEIKQEPYCSGAENGLGLECDFESVISEVLGEKIKGRNMKLKEHEMK
jgi:hypothetical protein